MRYFLFSAIIHLFVVVLGLFTLRDGLEFQRVGDPTVTFSMVGQAAYASGSSRDIVSAPPKTEPKPKVKRKKTAQKKVVREEKKILPEESTEEAMEKPIEKEIIQEPDTSTEDVAQEVQEESTDESVDRLEETSTEKETEDTDEEVNNTSTEIPTDQTQLGEGLVELEDGSIAAKNQGIKGLSYGFIDQPEPDYPDIARKMGFNSEVVIKVRFLIGYGGRVEDIKFYDNMKDFGFRNEVEKALNHWRTTPATVNGEKVKLYFYKSFKFEKL